MPGLEVYNDLPLHGAAEGLLDYISLVSEGRKCWGSIDFKLIPSVGNQMQVYYTGEI